ncbi:MAG: DUF4115 domain-containing protein, partial [Gammaproteobacteria bacterium]|nr:DUF4115 domain-containing protein [Gammaproteobacteria bacterium]
RAESRSEFKPEPRPVAKSEPRTELKSEPKIEPKAEPKADHKDSSEIGTEIGDSPLILEAIDPDRPRWRDSRRQATPRVERKPVKMPEIRLPVPPRPLLLRWALFAAVILLVGLLLYWGVGQLGKIRIRSPEAVMQNLQQQWSQWFGSEPVEAIPLPQTYETPGLSPPPIQPLSEDAQLLEQPPLTDSLFDPALDAASQVPASADTGGAKQIELHMLGSSWVEVEDASGDYRLVGELKKGEVHPFKGTPPYRVLFGRSNMVQIIVDGQPFDFSRLQQGAVARFTLNP